VKDLIQALPAPLDVVAGNTPVLREAAFDGDRAEVFGLDIAPEGQGKDEVAVPGPEFGLVRDDQEIAFHGISCLEHAVAPGNERREGIDAQPVGDIGKKGFQRPVVGDFQLPEVHGAFFSITVHPGISANPARR